MGDKKWRLGEDLFTSDSLLDGLTFDDIILMVHCNVPPGAMTPERVRKELRECLNGRLEDMWFLLEKNMDKVIEYARDFYRDE